jgi:L,D-peptidoglycan transpeptidase YkuD (ErfK/YbiS/YcfS/YnhG family)
MRRRGALLAAISLVTSSGTAALAQSCPVPLASARRLVLVTSDTMNGMNATLQTFERPSPSDPWQARSEPEPALLGKGGMGLSHFFRQLRRGNEPIKVEGDKRAPAGVYRIGRTFGIAPSSRPGHVQVSRDTVCVDDVASPAYNTITSRGRVGPNVRIENMGLATITYRRGLLVDYPTDAKARAGSCIFIHVWRSPTTGTAGCVALPEARVEALQDFSAAGAVLAILPRTALDRLAGCLPAAIASKRPD